MEKRDNKCLLRLLNNRRMTAMMVGEITGRNYITIRRRIEMLNFEILEARILAKHLNIPLEDFADILAGDEQKLSKYLINYKI